MIPNFLNAVQGLVLELHSSNQVPLTSQYLQSVIDAPSNIVLRATDQSGATIGIAILVVYPVFTNIRALLETMVVDPAYRSHGAGSALIERAKKEARARGVNTISLGTSSSNQAGKLFQRHGFIIAPNFNWYWGEL